MGAAQRSSVMDTEDPVAVMDAHTIIMLLCILSAVSGFAFGRLSLSSRKNTSLDADNSKSHKERIFFFKFTQLVLDLLPVLLRQYFRERWLARYQRTWRDTPADGAMFYYGTFEGSPAAYVQVEAGSKVVKGDLSRVMMPLADGSPGLSAGDLILIGDSELQKVQSVKPSVLYLAKCSSSSGVKELRVHKIRGETNMDSRMRRFSMPKLVQGDTRDWDMSLLCFALLYSSHALIPIGDPARQLVEGLRDLRNNKLAHISSCSMPYEELVSAVQKMDEFIEYCLPSEREIWLQTSRGILNADARDFDDTHTADFDGRLQHQYNSDIVAISIEGDSDTLGQTGKDAGTSLNETSWRCHQVFMDEAKSRWLTELSVAATLSPFSVSAVNFI